MQTDSPDGPVWTPGPFVCRVELATAESVDVTMTGELDAYSAPVARCFLAAILDAHPAQLVIDGSRISFVDAAGLGVLVSAARRARREGGRLVLDPVTPAMHQVLTLTRLLSLLPEGPPG